MTKHTPGPWHISEGAPHPYHHTIYSLATKSEHVGYIMDNNAQLIAAAPELLEALKNLINSPNIKECPRGMWSAADDHHYRLVRYAEEAITKAEGR